MKRSDSKPERFSVSFFRFTQMGVPAGDPAGDTIVPELAALCLGHHGQGHADALHSGLPFLYCLSCLALCFADAADERKGIYGLGKEKTRQGTVPCLIFFGSFVRLEPLVRLVGGHALDRLGRVGRFLAAHGVQEELAALGLIEGLLIALRVAELPNSVLFDQFRGLGIVFNFADDLFHGIDVLSFYINARVLFP